MKIRSEEELDKSLDEDLAWRRREFTTLNLLIQSAQGHEEEVLMRAAITLFYSHWEGHIKHCARVYLCYLNKKAPPYNDMSDNFIQLTLSERFKEGFSIKKFTSQKEIYDYIVNGKTGNFSVKEDIVIDTESNLKYEVILNIMYQLGLNKSIFELKKHFINSQLVKYRNRISHGERLTGQDVKSVYSEVEVELLGMITNFQNLIRNAVDTKSYLKSPAT